jgi:uncharacterized membrane protein
MPTVPLHPALVHVPLGLAFVLPLASAALAFALWRGLLPRRAWLIAVALQAVLLAGAGVALQTGERDEKRVERITGEAAIEAHEEAAEVFIWGAAIVLGAAAAVMVAPRRTTAALAAVAAAGTFVVAGLAYRTGKAGGDLVYARGGAAAYGTAAAATPSTAQLQLTEHENDDD